MTKSSSTKGGMSTVTIKDLPTTETKLTGKEMKEVQGGKGIGKVGLGVVDCVVAPKPVSGQPE